MGLHSLLSIFPPHFIAAANPAQDRKISNGFQKGAIVCSVDESADRLTDQVQELACSEKIEAKIFP